MSVSRFCGTLRRQTGRSACKTEKAEILISAPRDTLFGCPSCCLSYLTVIANSTALSTDLKAVSLPGRLRHCVRHKIFSPWKAVAECPVLFIERRDSSNDVAVDQRAQNRSPLYALKVPKPKDEKAHRHANQAAYAVVAGFEAVDVCTEMGGDLLHKKLVDLGGIVPCLSSGAEP